jgi:uncharacterized membrane protein
VGGGWIIALNSGSESENARGDDILHYDSLASSFLAAAATMLAIIAGLAPFLKQQNVLTGSSIYLLVAAALLQLVTILMSLVGLLGKRNLALKRKLVIMTVYPLAISGVLVFFDVALLLLG